MLDSFLFSVNTVLPVFFMVILGAILGKTGFLNDSFTSVSDRLVFRFALPVLLFLEIVEADISASFDVKFIVFCTCGILGVFAVACAVVPLFIKSNPKRGSYIQGVYRSNFAILGIPMAANMFGQAGSEKIAMMMPFAIILFNAIAVIIFSVFAPKDTGNHDKNVICVILRNVVTNPLIIAVVLALFFQLLPITMPDLMHKSLSYLSGLATPLALLCIGANFKMESLKGRIGLAISASVIKVVIVPLVMILLAIAVGLRDAALGGVLVLFGGPSAVSSYIMAKNMGGDYDLSAQIMLLTTLMSVVTMFFGTFLLRALQLI